MLGFISYLSFYFREAPRDQDSVWPGPDAGGVDRAGRRDSVQLPLPRGEPQLADVLLNDLRRRRDAQPYSAIGCGSSSRHLHI